MREVKEFVTEYPHLADFVSDIRAAYTLHCSREIKGPRVSIQEAYKHVMGCKQCQDYVDVGRVGINQYMKDDPIPPLKFTKK